MHAEVSIPTADGNAKGAEYQSNVDSIPNSQRAFPAIVEACSVFLTHRGRQFLKVRGKAAGLLWVR